MQTIIFKIVSRFLITMLETSFEIKVTTLNSTKMTVEKTIKLFIALRVFPTKANYLTEGNMTLSGL